MKNLSALLVLLCFMVISFFSSGNNINVQNVSLEGQVAAEHYVFIEFDLSWDNSWRTTSVPNNWDAAWVFCKYRLPGGEWQHVYIHDTNHYVPYTAIIDVAPDTTGAFIYRASNGSGTNTWSNIRLRWDYGHQGINDDAALEVKVFAIEMVYVPQGEYYLGDSTSSAGFYTYPDVRSFFQVTSENEISTNMTSGDLRAYGAIEMGAIPANFPKGFGGFYVMKYEISQEQYVGFLNTLNRAQQIARVQADISGTTPSNTYVMNNMLSPTNRNGIRCESSLPASGPIVFYCDIDYDGIYDESTDGQNIVGNYLGWPDLASYLDWAGLRPMSELEFEKACRGPNNPVGGEYAWGNTLLNESPYTLDNDNTPGESISSLPQNTGNALYSVTGTLGYVFRCGIFAASSVNHTRMETGATYYGIMEMSGSVPEYVVNVRDNAGRSFTGLHGDGEILFNGNADVSYWPGMEGNSGESTPNGVFTTNGITASGGAGLKGSSNVWAASALRISDRSVVSGVPYVTRVSARGGRGVRTAP